jgi:hypothetical protein
MATLTAFNDMMEQFINELVETFPEEKTFKKYQVALDLARKSNPRQILNEYMAAVSPVSQRIMARDETVINDVKIQDLDLKAIWTDDLSEGSKAAIWQYMQTLIVIGTTISALPQDALSAIESMAKRVAESGDMSQLGALMSGLTLPGKNPGKM